MVSIIDFLNNFARGNILKNMNFATRDFIDIFIIALLIYVLIRILRGTHSISVVVGFLVLAAIYGLALIFDLPLTSFILKSFFGIFIIVIAIVFQRELRRFFSSFGFLGIARRLVPSSELVITAVSRAVSHLAYEKTGALIVFPGHESIERQLEGGYILNGEVSEPLLLSIFDKTSPGHDGALIIENNKITKFAVHLPLAEKIDKVKNFGLRHRAAMGLSERSDAFIVIVSEEKGLIRVAHEESLYQIDSGEELKRRIMNFYQEKFPKLNLINFLSWTAKNTAILGISLIISSVLFVLVNSKIAIDQKNFVIAPEFENAPAGYTVNDVAPREVTLTLQGRGFDLDSLKLENLQIPVDLNDVKDLKKTGWSRIQIDINKISLPFNLSVDKVDPANIRVQLIKNPQTTP